MHSVQSSKKQLKLRSRQRRHCHRTGVRAAATSTGPLEVFPIARYHTTPALRRAAATFFGGGRKSVPKIPHNTIVHGIVVSNLSLVLLQKEYIEQFYFEKRSGGGGPDKDPDDINYKLANLKQLYHG